MAILVTGVAGFIGSYVAKALLDRGETVIGIDDLNNYYDVSLKKARLQRIDEQKGFSFIQKNIADEDLFETVMLHKDIDRIVHLAAQAGVRYSLTHPFNYAESNLVGHLRLLECCRKISDLKSFVYASSSSVYGGNEKLPFSLGDRVDTPISLYAATKKSNELMSYSYSHLFGIVQTGLRFFTVYGPWGRPDMALYIFTKAIETGESIRVFNHGEMWRDFTYIDDIVKGTIAALDLSPSSDDDIPHRIYNLGNDRSEKLTRLIELLEESLGKKAECLFEDMQPGDIRETRADIVKSRRDLNFNPTINLEDGVPLFVKWFRNYYK